MKVEKKAYRRPQLVEYGQLTEVTRGWFGQRPDSGPWANIAPDCGAFGIGNCASTSS
jgi:hypothetical protein